MKSTRAPAFVWHFGGQATLIAIALLYALAMTTTIAHAADVLPSWNDGAAKQSVVEFVAKVTQEGGPDFVPPAARIAVFDNDGTLWCEQPLFVQFYFTMDRIKALSPQHPEWKDKEPFASFLKGDLDGVLAATAGLRRKLEAQRHWEGEVNGEESKLNGYPARMPASSTSRRTLG